MKPVKSNNSGFIQMDDIDPAVAGLIRRPKKSTGSKKERSKYQATKERRKLVVLDPIVIEWLVGTARSLNNVSDSSVVNFALHYLRAAVMAGALDLDEYREETKNPRFKFALMYPQISTNDD
jgi:hypothetical protein